MSFDLAWPHRSDGRARLLHTARELFFAEGFHGVTTDRIARAARVSKATLYKHFPDMGLLLQAVIEREADTIPGDGPERPATAADFWSALRQYGGNLLTLLNRADVIRFDRLIHEQARTHAGLGERFFDATYGRALRDLEAMLAYGMGQGFIQSSTTPGEDAEMLLSLWESIAFNRARLGLSAQPFPDPARWVERCIERLYPNDVW